MFAFLNMLQVLTQYYFLKLPKMFKLSPKLTDIQQMYINLPIFVRHFPNFQLVNTDTKNVNKIK